VLSLSQKNLKWIAIERLIYAITYVKQPWISQLYLFLTSALNQTADQTSPLFSVFLSLSYIADFWLGFKLFLNENFFDKLLKT
jgi:hypothetical protein